MKSAILLMAGILSSECVIGHLPPHVPPGFSLLSNIDPTIIQSVRYATSQNFMGRKMYAYNCPHIVISTQAGEALSKVQKALNAQGYSLVVYDAYRPQRTVDSFLRWSFDDADRTMQEFYYPTWNISKVEFFEQGYIAKKSGHTRGSTVDLTIIELGKQVHEVVVSKRTLPNGDVISFLDDGTVDMGSSFDLFHVASHQDSPLIVNPEHIKNREILRKAMKENGGFNEYADEWWHFTLANEPFPSTYFDFVLCEDEGLPSHPNYY
jgi:D-alanyl-D-alanine dipeptidase